MILLTSSFDNFILDEVKSVVVDWPGKITQYTQLSTLLSISIDLQIFIVFIKLSVDKVCPIKKKSYEVDVEFHKVDRCLARYSLRA